MSFPSFFGGLFSELIPGGGDCSSIEQDPNADPFDKEVCQQFRRFNDAFGRNLDIEHRSTEEERRGGEGRNDPQSLRDAVLNRPDSSDREELPRRRWDHGFGHHYERHPKEDEDLDDRIRRDPRLLDKYLDSDTETKSRQESPHFHSSYSSVIITTKPDGTMEEQRTVVDSDGNEKTTVRYSDGRQRADRRIDIQGKMKEFWDRISKL